MRRLICVAIIGIIGFAGCAGVNGGNQQTGGDDMLNRPPNKGQGSSLLLTVLL